MNGCNVMVRAAVGLFLLAAAVILTPGCADMTLAGLRLAPDEPQKQAAQGADDLAAQLIATGARPGSAASRALAKMTRPSAVYAGAPKTPLNMESLAQIEAGQWRHKDDQVKTARLRSDLRARAMGVATVRLASLAEDIAKPDAKPAQIADRMGAVAEVAQMTDQVAAAIPDPRSPDETRSPEVDRLAAATAEAVEKLSTIASGLAGQRPDAATVVDKALDAADKTAAKAVETIERGVGIYEKYAPELITILGAFGIGAGGYAVKKRRDAGKAQAERDEVKTEATLQARIDAAIQTAKIPTAQTTADGAAG